MLIPFSLPSVAGEVAQPVWDGRVFVRGGVKSAVLEYSENFAGWSDDLTLLHETVIGGAHPVDTASRSDAVRQVSTALVSPDAVIMEIGCSSGYLLRDLIAQFPKATVVGADVVKAPLYRLAEAMPGVPLIRFDLLQCPLPAGSIDVLVMLNVLEHIEDDGTALARAYDLVKPGGCLVMEVPACQFLFDSYDQQLHHFRRYSASGLRSKLESVGFVVTRSSHLGFLLFPGFAFVKLINKFRGKLGSTVQKQAASTSSSILVAWAMNLEQRWLGGFSLPFGIRVLITARRPIDLDNVG